MRLRRKLTNISQKLRVDRVGRVRADAELQMTGTISTLLDVLPRLRRELVNSFLSQSDRLTEQAGRHVPPSLGIFLKRNGRLRNFTQRSDAGGVRFQPAGSDRGRAVGSNSVFRQLLAHLCSPADDFAEPANKGRAALPQRLIEQAEFKMRVSVDETRQ